MFLFSFQIQAAPMGAEAVEIFQVMSNYKVKRCFLDLGRSLVNVSIDKEVSACPGCVTYTIAGKFLEIDTPRPEKVKVVIKGASVQSNLGDWRQQYSCQSFVE